MTIVKLALGGILFFLALTFSYQNDFPVIVRYWGITDGVEVPFYVAVVVAFFGGVIVGGVSGLISNFLLKKELKQWKKQAEQM